MALDFSKLRSGSLVDKEPNPREIFTLLANKNPKYQYLRDVQSEVLARWFERRKEKDLVLKMNTGGGKTVVGLLLLKSCLNEGAGPSYFVVPDNYLLSQVEAEAKMLGIPVSREHDSPAVMQGKAIGILNIFKLFHGFSSFGVGEAGIKLPIGAIVVDDAHACMSSMESQFSISVGQNHEIYKELFELFKGDLTLQNASTTHEIESGDPGPTMLVPFWAWHQKHEQVSRILSKHRSDEEIKFNWPLLKNFLTQCRCVFGEHKVEISPKCIPVEAIPSFEHAQRRVFMTATLADDSILVTDFKASPESVKNHITPKTANDIGDRMILIPQEINPNITDEEIKHYVVEKSKQYNVVVIVGSDYRANSFWVDVANRICNKNNIEATVNEMKAGHVGLVILSNKYDGIDLPNSACRILVLDGLPKARRLAEKVENNFLMRSRHIIGKQVQRIEQGMGRGVRANDDYCVVLLMGGELSRVLYLQEAKDMFSPATLAQLNLAKEITTQIDGGLDDIDAAAKNCLEQNPEWKAVARERLANVGYAQFGSLRNIAIAQRKAFDAAIAHDNRAAAGIIQNALNTEQDLDSISRGWMMWQLAEYMDATDPVEAQKILKAAISHNRRLTKPLEGIDYEKLNGKNIEQSRNAVWYLRAYEKEPNKLVMDLNGIVDELVFKPDSSKAFEEAMREVALLIGFGSQRPELEYSSGPDNLWAVGNLQYFVIECKNGATTMKVSKDDTNQLGGSVNWFYQHYDRSCNAIPILVHPSNTFEFDAAPHELARVMKNDGLESFKAALRGYVNSVTAKVATIEQPEVLRLLAHYNFTPDKFLATYSKMAKIR